MKLSSILGAVLIVLGVGVIGYGYIPQREVHRLSVGSREIATVETEEKSSDPIPLIIGGICVVAGLAFVFKS